VIFANELFKVMARNAYPAAESARGELAGANEIVDGLHAQPANLGRFLAG
jgi:hypothetical protein